MDRSLFAFIWRHSWRDQIVLLILTVLSFPLLYASLELPKRIINDAIGAVTERVTVLGGEVSRTEYLVLLCLLFLAAVVAGGLVKMRVNTMRGVLAERLLRRFRFQLLARMLRFPRPYYRTTSQGELVSMITAEAEPMGGLMGDALAQPAFLAGQMLTILGFLFAQSVWFGLASVALIPLQAWLIPMLQRQINLMNKERIVELRHLASEIGETAAGIGDLRANGGWRYRKALFTDRLGRLFRIRFRIYRKKYFMKFLNNFITQLTPFFFYLVGGLLAIRGEITVGALVAGLAAYKDLAGPWRELLLYYNQVQDMSLRWEIVTERFQPRNMIDEALIEGEPDEIPSLDGDIEITDVTVRDEDGHAVLEDITLTIPDGARVAVECADPVERAAFAELLTREVLPARGSVSIGGRPLNGLHQAVIAARIGYAHSRPYLFDGTLGDNILMPLRARPIAIPDTLDPVEMDEARRTGNSTDPLEADWLDPRRTGLPDREAVGDWWFRLVRAMGMDESILRRALRARIDPAEHPDLTRTLVALRPQVAERLAAAGLSEAVHRFDPDRFNPAIPLGGNLLFAVAARDIPQETLAADGRFIAFMRDHDLAEETMNIAQAVIETLERSFGREGTHHPLFRGLGMSADLFRRLCDIAARRRTRGDRRLRADEKGLLLTVPFMLTAEQIGPGLPQHFRDKIVAIRKAQMDRLRRDVGRLFEPIAPGSYISSLTVLENLLYGRVARAAGARAEEIEDQVIALISARHLRAQVAATVFDLRTGIGGANLPTVLQERAAFSRAGIKRPDILILDRALASHDAHQRHAARANLREMLPGTTMIFMESHFNTPEEYDMFIRIEDGRVDGGRAIVPAELGGRAADDFLRKLRIIARAEIFRGLDARNQKLLAYSAQWFAARPGQVIFRAGQSPDAVYLCVEGQSHLRLPGTPEEAAPLTVVEPGRLIGDLAVLVDEPRMVDLVARTESVFLRIAADDLRSVIAADADVAVALLRTVAGHLSSATALLADAQGQLSAALTRRDAGAAWDEDDNEREG